MEHLRAVRYVAPGGALGAAVRWAVLTIAGADQALEATVVLNVVGSILLGYLVGGRRRRPPARSRRVTTNQLLLAGTGFCGGLTTFSSYALQVAIAIDDGDAARAAIVTAATALPVVMGAGIGYRFGSRR